jgi:hypothetical protein
VWPVGANEELRYEWQVSGIARLLLPAGGDGLLTTTTANGVIRTELLITTAGTDDFFRYGSSLDHAGGDLVSAWSAYRFGKKEKSRDQQVDVPGVIDVASGILFLRREKPLQNQFMTIWSDGRLYPVVIEHRGLDNLDGDRVGRHYTVRGRNLVGERHWKGSLDLWLALDAAATPLQIEVARSFSKVELRLVDGP